MHNIKDIRKDPDGFTKLIKDRNTDIDIEKILKIDEKNRSLVHQKELLEQEKKKISKNKDELLYTKSKELSLNISNLEKKINDFQIEINNLIILIPNVAKPEVPIGKNDSSNKILYEKGEIPKFDFKIKSHDELGKNLNMIDFDLASLTTGSRFVFLKNRIANLERALSSYMIDTHVAKNDYLEISPPLIANLSSMFGTGQMPKFENDQFELKLDKSNERKFLIPTAEVILTNMVREKILSHKDLPIRLVASTSCFRKEAGSYGKDTKGMIRQHQFYKVELVSIVKPENTDNELERMTSCAEGILKNLKLPYRKILLSTGDMGFSAEKTYDLEVWIPSENKYREISSCSSCGSFQSKRMKARYKSEKNQTLHVSTLNGSGLAVGRTLIAILENYQQKDGSITVPEALIPYMGNKNIVK